MESGSHCIQPNLSLLYLNRHVAQRCEIMPLVRLLNPEMELRRRGNAHQQAVAWPSSMNPPQRTWTCVGCWTLQRRSRNCAKSRQRYRTPVPTRTYRSALYCTSMHNRELHHTSTVSHLWLLTRSIRPKCNCRCVMLSMSEGASPFAVCVAVKLRVMGASVRTHRFVIVGS